MSSADRRGPPGPPGRPQQPKPIEEDADPPDEELGSSTYGDGPPGEDRLARAQRLAAARGIVTGASPRSDSDELLAMLAEPPPEDEGSGEELPVVRPGEVPQLRSDRPLWIFWGVLVLVLVAVGALGTWAVFFSKPY